MATKAKNAPPWTRRKLFKYRTEQRERREAERKQEREMAEEHRKSGDSIDRVMRGIGE